ncbi:MAG: hypothetical protein FH748_16530 [Balneolaceae bacterium]|nr:hypothetical protein [Balneolaceae bacterium]
MGLNVGKSGFMMGNRFILTGLLIILLTSPISAQVQQDNKEIKRLQHGSYKFTQGVVQLTFQDTVSNRFVKEQLEGLGYNILQMKVNPITAGTKANPPEEMLLKLSKHPYVDQIRETQRGFPEEAFQEMLERRENVTEKEAEELRKRFMEFANTRFPTVIFKYHITKEMLPELLEEYVAIGLKLRMIVPRMAIVETEVGREKEVMRKLNKLHFVKNTAFVAGLDND